MAHTTGGFKREEGWWALEEQRKACHGCLRCFSKLGSAVVLVKFIVTAVPFNQDKRAVTYLWVMLS